jgi:phosphopantothenoylcysteine decarboxylase/phosphopantothenate--cysteine ligase
LKENKKYIFIDPRKGVLACRDEGEGKIADNKDIFEKAKNILLKKK